ncbi:hypothetical protein QQ045_032565 [Rhodiola kirilowii]
MAKRIDREYKVSQKVNSTVRAAQDKARKIDCEYEVSQKWRGFVLDFSRYWPRIKFTEKLEKDEREESKRPEIGYTRVGAEKQT